MYELRQLFAANPTELLLPGALFMAMLPKLLATFMFVNLCFSTFFQ